MANVCAEPERYTLHDAARYLASVEASKRGVVPYAIVRLCPQCSAWHVRVEKPRLTFAAD